MTYVHKLEHECKNESNPLIWRICVTPKGKLHSLLWIKELIKKEVPGIETGQEFFFFPVFSFFSWIRRKTKEAQGNEWFIRAVQSLHLVSRKALTRHRPHRLAWAPRLNGLLTVTGQRHQKCGLVVEVTFRWHPSRQDTQRGGSKVSHTTVWCYFSIQLSLDHIVLFLCFLIIFDSYYCKTKSAKKKSKGFLSF